MEVELKKKSKKKVSLIIGILLVLVLTISFSYALFRYSKTTANQQLVAGDIYMKAISNEVTSGNIKPMDKEEGKTNGNKYKFKVEGYNNSKKDIYYGIYLKYGEEQTGKERFKDEDIVVYLTETKDGVTKDVFGPGRLSDFNRNMIYSNTISGTTEKEDKVDIDYELTVWLSDNVLISDTEKEFEGKHIYTTSEYENSYFSLDVEVEGDFVEKEIVNDETEVEAIEVESNKEYDIENHPMSDEDVKVILKTTKEATKAVVTNVTESKKQELTPTKVANYYQVEIIAEKTAKYNYYFVYKDSKISDTYSFNVNINPERYTLIEKPTETICIARTYNGKSQDLVSNDKEGYTLENYQGKDAGSYKIIAKLQDKYRWSDKSKEDITINCSIGKKDLIVTPDSNQTKVYGTDDKDLTYTYTGNLEEPAFTGKLGRAEGNDVGTYQINKGTLDIEDKLPFKKSNYNLKFSETPVNFEITKSTPKLTLSSETGEVLEGKSVTITGTVSPSIGGTYSVTTSKEGIVTTKVNGNEITITGVSNGSVDVVVTFKPTDTKNYSNSNSATYKVTGYKVASEATCLNPTYNGAAQALASGETGITLGSNSGVDASDSYKVTETLQSGYRWSDNSTANKTLTCKINKKAATITASNQTVTYGTGITNAVSQATTKDLVTNHTLGSITLQASTKDVPGGKITASNAKIMSGASDVTANYSLSYVDGTLTINKKQITVTPNSGLSKTYGDADPTIGYSNAGAISGENPVFSGKLGRTTGENVGTYPVNIGNLTLSDGTGFKANNYSLTLASGTYNFTINQRATTITPVAQTITYGGKIDTAVNKATASNLVSGHSLSQVTISTTATNVPGGKITASNAKISASGTDVTSNYKISYAEGTLTITKADIGIGTCADKVYNGKSQELVNKVTSGVSYTDTTGIDAKTYTITVKPDSNHKFAGGEESKTLSCKITPKGLDITWENPGTYTYTGSPQGPSGTVASGVENETVKLTITKQINAGTKLKSTAVIESVEGGRANKGNYSLNNPSSAEFTINKATPTLTITPGSGTVNAKSIVTFKESASVKGKFSNVSSSTSIVTVAPGTIDNVAANAEQTVTVTGVANGSAEINVTFTPSDINNYNTKTGEFSVTGYKVASEATCSNPTYNGAAQALASGGTGITLGSNSGVDAKDNYSVTETLQSGYRWSDNSTGNKTLTCKINKKAATITASNQTVTYGTGITNAVSQATAKDLVTNHTLGGVTLTASTKDVPGGKITASNAKIMSGTSDVTANYNLSYVEGTLTINKKQITVTPNSNLSKTYGDANPTIGYSNAGAISGENPVFSGKLGRTTGENVGTYPINLGGLTLSDGTGFKANNYSLALASGTYNFTINQRATTITPVAQTITYGGKIDTAVSKATASNLVSGHALSQVTISTTATNVPGGKITASGAKISASGTDVTSNYKISYAEGNLTINKATPTLTLSASSGNVWAGSTISFTASAKFNNNDVAGTYTATSVSSNIATASVSGNTITITGVGAGTTNITVGFKPTDTINYNSAATKTYSVTSKTSTASDILAKAKEKSCNPIIEEDGITYFSGDNECIDFNYVWYSGKLWRITSINSDGTMKMITQDTITAIYWGEDATYKDSRIYQWLNEDFKDTLYNYKNIIVQNAEWNATPDGNSTPIKPPTDDSATIVQGDVGSLNAYEYYQSYKNTSYSKGYLNIGYYWWLITPYTGSNVLRVGTSGYLYSESPSSSVFGVRPSINLKSNIQLNGEGTKSNPYTITIDKATGKSGELINTRISGEYVKVNGKDYRIVGIENGTTKLTSVDYVRDDGGTVLTKNFGSNTSWATSVSNDSDDKYWSYYLNNTWITPELEKYITEGTYYLGTVGSSSSYKNSICSTSNTSEPTRSCEKTSSTWTGEVGLPRMGEMFSAQLGSGYSSSSTSTIWLITPYSRSSVRYVRNDGFLYNSSPSSNAYGVRPSINLKSGVKIASGSGTESSPYQVSLGTSSPSNEGPSIVDDNVGTNKTASLGSCNNLIYNGEEQTLVSGGKNVVYSNNKGTEAGTYTVTATTKNGYFFNDGSTSKTLSCTIEKKAVTVNYSNNNVKYTGGLVAPKATAIGVNGEKLELETTKASEVGSYTTVATMKSVNPNYTLRNTVIDYEITKDDVKEEISDIKTKVVINYYLINKDGINYTLVNSKEIDSKIGDSITGEVLNYKEYESPKEITIKVVNGTNIINYYYERV